MRASQCSDHRFSIREEVVLADRRRPLAQITSGDLDVAVLGQLPATQLTLRDHLEPCALKVECLDAPLGRRTLIEEPLEDPTSDPDTALIGTEDDAEFDGVALMPRPARRALINLATPVPMPVVPDPPKQQVLGLRDLG
jgi:hypothetical protein